MRIDDSRTYLLLLSTDRVKITNGKRFAVFVLKENVSVLDSVWVVGLSKRYFFANKLKNESPFKNVSLGKRQIFVIFAFSSSLFKVVTCGESSKL